MPSLGDPPPLRNEPPATQSPLTQPDCGTLPGVPYKKAPLSELAKKMHPVKSPFESTPDWKRMRADLEHGFQPGEGLQVLITDADRAKYRLPKRRPIARCIQAYLKAHGMTYAVRSFRRPEGDYFQVYAPQARRAKSA